MHVAYAILMTTPWIIGTMLVLAGIGAIVGKFAAEEMLYRAGVRAYKEDKAEKDREALEDLVKIFEEMLARVEARERAERIEVMYSIAMKHIHSESPILINQFDLSEFRNVHCMQKVHGAFATIKKTGTWPNTAGSGVQRYVEKSQGAKGVFICNTLH